MLTMKVLLVFSSAMCFVVGIYGMVVGRRLRPGGVWDRWGKTEGRITEYSDDRVVIEYTVLGMIRKLKKLVVQPVPIVPWPDACLEGRTIMIHYNEKFPSFDTIALDSVSEEAKQFWGWRQCSIHNPNEEWYLISLYKALFWGGLIFLLLAILGLVLCFFTKQVV